MDQFFDNFWGIMAFVLFFSYILLFVIIEAAVRTANKKGNDLLEVQNQLLRSQMDVHARSLEELEANYRKRFYTQENYKDFKKYFRNKEREQNRTS